MNIRHYLLIIMLLALCPLAAWAQPKIHSPTPRHDFGTRLMSNLLDHEFIIQNTGDELLKIGHVQRVCGCTSAEPEKDTLEPGEQTVIKTQLRPMGGGRTSKDIYIHSNDPEQGRFTIGFDGEWVPDIVVDPVARHVGVLRDYSTLEEPITLRAGTPDVTFALTGEVECDADWLEFAIEEVCPGTEYRILPVLTATPPAGSLSLSFYVPTDNPNLPQATARITGYIIGDYTVSPDILRFIFDESPDSPKELVFSVSEGRLGAFEVLEIIPPVEGLKIDMKPSEDKSRYFFTLPNFPVDNPEISGKEIIIKTNHDAPVRVPILAIEK